MEEDFFVTISLYHELLLTLETLFDDISILMMIAIGMKGKGTKKLFFSMIINEISMLKLHHNT